MCFVLFLALNKCTTGKIKCSPNADCKYNDTSTETSCVCKTAYRGDGFTCKRKSPVGFWLPTNLTLWVFDAFSLHFGSVMIKTDFMLIISRSMLCTLNCLSFYLNAFPLIFPLHLHFSQNENWNDPVKAMVIWRFNWHTAAVVNPIL
jgi:hypothetical protein